MYAQLITALNWTWEYIDENMTLPRLNSLSAHWKQYPPVHISVARYLGYTSSNTQDDQDEVVDSAPIEETLDFS